jgi:uncharacterized membrane protein YfcA
VVGAGILATASFVYGLTGFGIGLVALSLLPFLIPPATVVPLIIVYGAVFALTMTIQLRREIVLSCLAELLLGTLLGTPAGVWVLATLPAAALKRLIGLMLIVLVLIEWCGAYPRQVSGRGWGVGAGVLSGLLGGAIATPGPPVILYVVAQGWQPRAIKATLQAFLVVNQTVIFFGHWWAGLVTPDVVWLAVLYAMPASAGFALGIHLFNRVDQLLFRRLIFVLLFVLGLVLGLSG